MKEPKERFTCAHKILPAYVGAASPPNIHMLSFKSFYVQFHLLLDLRDLIFDL